MNSSYCCLSLYRTLREEQRTENSKCVQVYMCIYIYVMHIHIPNIGGSQGLMHPSYQGPTLEGGGRLLGVYRICVLMGVCVWI